MPCVFFCYVIICYLFSEATAFVLESSKNSTGKFLCWSLFFPENGKIISRRLFCMNKSYFCRNFFLIDWCHKRLKNTIDLSLFYGEHFYGFLESDLWKRWKKTFILQQTHLYIQATDILKFYEVLFCTYCKGLFCL